MQQRNLAPKVATANSSPAIEVRKLSRHFSSLKKSPGWRGALRLLYDREYSERRALEDVSFAIQPGEFVGLIGANGAGKTTLLKILSGLLPPSKGEVLVLGENPFARSISFRMSIALVMGQKAQLWWDLPALDAFELIRAVYNIPPDLYQERLTSLTKILGVTELLQTQIRRLSLGERMKMELIGAILHWPGIVFLDEPTIGLDLLAAKKLREFLKSYNELTKSTIILTSHNMDDIESLCSRVMLLKEGSLIYDSTPNGLISDDERVMNLTLKEAPEIQTLQALLLEAPSISSSSVSMLTPAGQSAQSFRICLEHDQVGPALQRIMTRFTLLDMKLEEPSLETVIQRVYERGGMPK